LSFWVCGNLGDAIDAVIQQTAGGAPRVLLDHRIPFIDVYWRFFALAHQRGNLVNEPVFYDYEKAFDQASAPAGTLLVTPAGVAPFQMQGWENAWDRVLMVTEPNGLPSFAVFQKTQPAR
jgi:hypothetical protein